MTEIPADIRVQQLKEQWALALMTEGVIVSLEVRHWRGWTTLSPEDLGFHAHTEEFAIWMKDNIRFGSQRILPKAASKEITQIRASAKKNLKRYAFPTLWGFFLPYTAFMEWKEENDRYRELFLQAGQELGDRHSEVVALVRKEYQILGKSVWKQLYGNTSEPTVAWMENFLGRIIAKIPNAERMTRSFRYTTTFLSIPLPSFIEQDVSDANQIIREEERKEHEESLYRQAKIEISEHYRAEKERLIDTFLNQTVHSLHIHIQEACDEILDRLGRLHQRTGNPQAIHATHMKRIKQMIQDVRTLNFFNDKEINTLLDELQNEIEKFRGNINTKNVLSSLHQLKDIAVTDLDVERFNPTTEYLEI